ncbi:MAG TPA: glycine--tRNA ligase [Chitinophagaceae bacterium]|nr:glycine--tRNA ligase [Chitinophagaceae bacterium]
MAKKQNPLQNLIAHSKEYGFIFPSSDIYDGLSAVYDYGQNGAQLKKNIRDYWWKSMTQMHENVVGLDASIFMHPTTWQASGHLDNFSDPMIDNKDSKKRYRVDHLIEEKAAKLEAKGKTEKANLLIQKMDALLKEDDFEGLKKLIEEENILCPVSGTGNWTDIRQFNLMFSTQVGSVSSDTNELYLRPETAQGIFVNFLNVRKTARMKIPFGIAQTGKAFRNEIVARQFIFRMREFEQMEMQFFVRPGTELEWFEHWKTERVNWHKSLGINPDNLQFHEHSKLAHYANAAVDIEYKLPIGFKEIEGIHSRTDFDLSRHQEFSGKKLQYFDPDINKNYIPYVIETSAGLDRIILMVLSEAYCEEEVPSSKPDKTETRKVMKFDPKLAPIKLAILPLTKKDGLPEIAKDLFNDCKPYFQCESEIKGSIGKRYRRQDAIGTPFCVTIDHQTKEDETVTIRYRDSLEQERLPLKAVKDKVFEAIQG